MSQFPRRTSEFQASSVRKSVNPRPSRIAQPSQFPRTSATPSMARMTPSRTPNRSSSKDRNNQMVPQTAEKEKAPVDDKVLVNAKSQQILDELSKSDRFNELVQKGLKTMTHKQFIMILQLFLRPIVGNVHLDGSNYVDYVISFLGNVEYPYTLFSKSSLKTPTAPHCHNHIVLFLAWLLEFKDEELAIEYTATEDFSSKEDSAMFMKKTSEAFVLWNNQNIEESDGIFEEIRQDYIQKRTGNSGSLDSELTKLREDIENMSKKAKPVSVQQEHNEKMEESKRLNRLCEKLKKEIEDLTAKLGNAKFSLQTKSATKQKAAQELKDLRKKLNGQKMTLDEKKKLLVEITQAKSVLASKRAALLELVEAESKKEIQMSNLIQKKFQLADKLNNLFCMLICDLEVGGKIDSKNFLIKSTKTDEAGELMKELERMQSALKDLTVKHKNAIDAINQDTMKLDAEKRRLLIECDRITTEAGNLKASFDAADEEEEKIENELKIFVNESEEKFQQNEIEIKRITEEIEAIEEKISQLHKMNAEIAEQKSTFKAKSLKDCRELYEKRKQEVEQARMKLAMMQNFVNEFNKKRKPLPEEVQKLCEELAQKYKDEN